MTNCDQCREPLPDGAKFCPNCGQQVESGESASERELMARTRPSTLGGEDLTAARDAIDRYLKSYTRSPNAWHVTATLDGLFHCMRGLNAAGQHRLDKTEWINPVEFCEPLANVPAILANGLRTDARVSDVEDRDGLFRVMTLMGDIMATCLEGYFQAAEQEVEGLLVDGETRAVVERKTLDDCYDEAERHYQAYLHGNLDDALLGFRRLKALNPYDAYFRLMLAATYQALGRHTDSLRENLYGFAQDPGNSRIRANLIADLVGFGLYPSALEVANHAADLADLAMPGLERDIRAARASVAMVFSTDKAAEHYDDDAKDALDELPVPARPWLREPYKGPPDELHARASEGRIFVSYRRAGALAIAERIERELERRYERMHVFRDESDLVVGQEWADSLRAEIRSADVCVVLIDPDWRRDGRILEHDDIVRIEVETALRSFVDVMPVLIDGAAMPTPEMLPDSLHPVTRIQAVTLASESFDKDFGWFVGGLFRVLKSHILRKDATKKHLGQLGDRLEKGEDVDLRLHPSVLQKMQGYISENAVANEGVYDLNLDGFWEARTTTPHGSLELRFTIVHQQPFHGEFIANGTTRKVSGNWHPILHVDEDHDPEGSQRTLGLFLDGLFEDTAEPFKARIPIHRHVGKFLEGTDQDGYVWYSRNARPSAF